MQETLRMLVYMTKNDPAAVLGFMFIGTWAMLFIHIQLMMIRAGYKTSFTFIGKPMNGWDTPLQYLKVSGKHGWSRWPVYLLLPFMVGGVLLLIFGLLRL